MDKKSRINKPTNPSSSYSRNQRNFSSGRLRSLIQNIQMMQIFDMQNVNTTRHAVFCKRKGGFNETAFAKSRRCLHAYQSGVTNFLTRHTSVSAPQASYKQNSNQNYQNK